jgi:hypothetical protein
MARPERFELPTTAFEAQYSIQLSYGRGAKGAGTVALPRRRRKSEAVKREAMFYWPFSSRVRTLPSRPFNPQRLPSAMAASVD